MIVVATNDYIAHSLQPPTVYSAEILALKRDSEFEALGIEALYQDSDFHTNLNQQGFLISF